ncbi:MAG: Gfo/Idh/MocA family oxidoreductase [Chitinophagaceae bacterium]|nr:MAG: Gfo/Idh/MocA family oxidoreductase [Chitinophagaceae bacterium]
MKDGRLGVALVGLGKYAEGQLAPALQQTSHCYLAGIVSGTPEKLEQWKSKYKLADNACYTYQDLDLIKDNSDIDIVYVVLPNALHAEYVVKAAQAGKHVLCEKPMAVTVEECDRMLKACKEAGKMLGIGYRLHFEPHNQEAMRLGQQKVYGKISLIEADHGLAEVEGWRLDKTLAGGGPLMDVGIYCVQAVRYVTGMEPVAVTAQEGFKHDHEKFASVEESINWQMEMPDGSIAKCTSSYAEKTNRLRVEAENGWFELSPAYPYSGVKGKTANGEMRFPEVNQQALQMDEFALCIKEGRPSNISGEEGRQDVKILQAIYKAMQTGERVMIDNKR